MKIFTSFDPILFIVFIISLLINSMKIILCIVFCFENDLTNFRFYLSEESDMLMWKRWSIISAILRHLIE